MLYQHIDAVTKLANTLTIFRRHFLEIWCVFLLLLFFLFFSFSFCFKIQWFLSHGPSWQSIITDGGDGLLKPDNNWVISTPNDAWTVVAFLRHTYTLLFKSNGIYFSNAYLIYLSSIFLSKLLTWHLSGVYDDVKFHMLMIIRRVYTTIHNQ